MTAPNETEAEMPSKNSPVPPVEWLLADGRGGFASGTSEGTRTRRYHALLLVATTPPTGRMVLVNGADVALLVGDATYPLVAQAYGSGHLAPDVRASVRSFHVDPWPTFTYTIEGGIEIKAEIFVRRDVGATVLRYELARPIEGARLEFRPFLSGRTDHGLHVKNEVFRFAPEISEGRVRFMPYDGVPPVVIRHNGTYRHDPHWYLDFSYREEAARGYADREDLAAPGVLSFDLGRGAATLILSSEADEALLRAGAKEAGRIATDLAQAERRRRKARPSPLARAAEDYLVQRASGRSIIAGYPWFADWGRDTFISLRGLCLPLDDADTAWSILSEWAEYVSMGMLPNRFPDASGEPEYNSVDAALWFVIAASETFAHPGKGHARARKKIEQAIVAILEGYAMGTRHGIAVDEDGLLRAGEPGVQLTWMDAKIGDDVITPRIGKPVEVQALWMNALMIGATIDASLDARLELARKNFQRRFFDETLGHLYDVVDADHVAGKVDPTMRPNQIYAVGGLPNMVVDLRTAKSVVACVEERLWTPAGLRSLDPLHPDYCPRYEGGILTRDRAYHQGTVWPYLAGPFIEAWIRAHPERRLARSEARQRFFAPFLLHTDPYQSGHLPEIADGDQPHRSRGCPFQAWSVGEALRLDQLVLKDTQDKKA